MTCCLSITQGSTFTPALRYKSSTGDAIDLTNIGVECWITSAAGVLIARLEVIKLDQTTHKGMYTFAAQQTSDWLAGMATLFIRYVIDDATLEPSRVSMTIRSI